MIDIENEVFNTLATVLRAEYNPISIYGETVDVPSVFPCVVIEERDNRVYERSQTGATTENHASVMYEINVYSNKRVGKKAEVKAIFNQIDTEMANMNFTRKLLNPIGNLADGTIYRMVGRYQAVVSTDHVLYRG